MLCIGTFLDIGMQIIKYQFQCINLLQTTTFDSDCTSRIKTFILIKYFFGLEALS